MTTITRSKIGYDGKERKLVVGEGFFVFKGFVKDLRDNYFEAYDTKTMEEMSAQEIIDISNDEVEE